MKKLLLIILILFSIGCNKKPTINNYYKDYEFEYEIISIDSCEYIMVDVYNRYSIEHKGNCKYCIERNK